MEEHLNKAANIRAVVQESSEHSSVHERNKAMFDCLVELHRCEKEVIAATTDEADRARRQRTYHEFWTKLLAREAKQLDLQSMIVQACTAAVVEYTPK